MMRILFIPLITILEASTCFLNPPSNSGILKIGDYLQYDWKLSDSDTIEFKITKQLPSLYPKEKTSLYYGYLHVEETPNYETLINNDSKLQRAIKWVKVHNTFESPATKFILPIQKPKFDQIATLKLFSMTSDVHFECTHVGPRLGLMQAGHTVGDTNILELSPNMYTKESGIKVLLSGTIQVEEKDTDWFKPITFDFQTQSSLRVQLDKMTPVVLLKDSQLALRCKETTGVFEWKPIVEEGYEMIESELPEILNGIQLNLPKDDLSSLAKNTAYIYEVYFRNGKDQAEMKIGEVTLCTTKVVKQYGRYR